ncbi:MAG TPA: class I tRNA ligase family protein, partial [Allosphingosinicella sp.]|nr:class I tRNA ligase family protein [Allosphingosinicella sp.]
GLDRFDARKRVVELLEAEGALEKVEDRVIATPFGDRSGVVIEPWLTDQWYVDAAKLAGPALEATRSGAIRIVPKTWEKTWFNWLENIQPWCVSRQLWWGHRIPAWYGIEFEPSPTSADGSSGLDQKGIKTFVAESEEEVREQALAYVREIGLAGAPGTEQSTPIVETEAEASELWMKGECYPLWRDQDVLDTWFSSALWPFATLGWPEQTEELARHYPNDLLISGFDIIFFWDARMAMQGIHLMGERPWKTLYLHGLVRDPKGRKMSKTLGNTVDPLGLIDRFGADALRFTLAAMESQGRDIKLDEKRVEGYRNFATKLWNAARFCQANGIGASAGLEPPQATLPVNRWIVGETVKTVHALDLSLADLRFDESANILYHFVWATFCDWYLELIKPVSSADERGRIDDETKAVAAWVLDQILVMLHPFMPFITEELWNANARPYPLIVAKWPMPDARALDPEAGPEVDWLIRLVSGIRAARAELNVPPGAKLPLHVKDCADGTRGRLERHDAALRRLARVESIAFGEASGGAAQVVVDEATYILPLEGVIDIEAERSRLAKAAEAAEKERDSLAGRLGNPSFVERAKPEAVEKARADHSEKASDAEKYRAALARLG